MSLLVTACDALVDALSAHPDFWSDPAVPVANAWRADHLDRIAMGLNAMEVCAFVYIRQAAAEETGLARVLSPVVLRVLLLENLAFNRSSKHVDDLAEAIAASLPGGRITGDGFTGNDVSFRLLGIEVPAANEYPVDIPEDASFALAAVDFATSIILPACPAQTDAPDIDEDGGELTMTVSGAAATIRYTTDGTLPTTSSPTYVAPIVAPGSEVHARAWRTGEVASDVSVWSPS